MRTVGLETKKPPTIDPGADARTTEEEVWFWDMILKKKERKKDRRLQDMAMGSTTHTCDRCR